MKGEIEAAITAACKELFGIDVSFKVTRPDEQYGDYATNAALQIAKQLGKSSREVAEDIANCLQAKPTGVIDNVNVAGPGFINIKLKDSALFELSQSVPARNRDGQNIVAEYSDANPFKVLHAGHLYTSVVGDSMANLLSAAGAKVHRVNYGSDVGLHVGKTMWAILQSIGGEQPNRLEEVAEEKRADWLSMRYVEGNTAYEEDESAKAPIIDINKRVYKIHEQHDHESSLAQIYWTCRQWCYDYFKLFYGRIGIQFEKFYPESVTIPLGLQTVREQLAKGVYEESKGAVVFRGELYGLHTRVFINSHGLPTYEAKDVGLIMLKWQDYHFDQSIIITDSAQAEYMAVVLKSIEQFAPQLAQATTHLTHGRVKLSGGVKMSSRLGNIVRASEVLDAAATANLELTGQDNPAAVLGAVKYAFLKQRIGADVVYDPKDSVSLEGNSGPYLQYAHARARSILQKSGSSTREHSSASDLGQDERKLLRKISEYSETLDQATTELMPHYICTYLYELAQVFNRFYEHNRVIGSDREELRLQLVELYADTLKRGLAILGISAPDHM